MPRKGDSKYQVGNRFDSKYGKVVVIEYINPKKLLIRFEETGYEYWTSSTRITGNELKDSSLSRVFGVGIVDVGYSVEQCPSGGPRIVCPYYRTWKNMLQRCYWNPEPSYIDCSVTGDWFYLNTFKAWMETQDWEGKHLDKDLLVRGNRVYGPDTCLFLSPEVNTFIVDKTGLKGTSELPGVRKRSEGRFIAQCAGSYIGMFKTEMEAHLAWKSSKLELARGMLGSIECERTASALLLRYSLDYV